MIDIQEMLERTSVKSVGLFLMNDQELWRRVHSAEIPAEGLMAEKYDNLSLSLRQSGEREKVDAAVRDIEEAAERIGFYAGLRAGARLMLALTDRGDVVC